MSHKVLTDRKDDSKVPNEVYEGPPAGGGAPLYPSVRPDLERAFGTSLEGVTLHDDNTTHQFVASRRAYAITFGQHIYLGPGSYRTDNQRFLHTLAHEVAHTVQQRSSLPEAQARDIQQYESFERQADQAAEHVLLGQRTQVGPGPGGKMLQADDPGSGPSPQIQDTQAAVLAAGSMTDEQRQILQTDASVYDHVVRQLISKDSSWISDTLLELWVSESEEWAIINRIRVWCQTPKADGSNYLDELLDALRDVSYHFSYLVTESASGSMLDKLFAEMEDERQAELNNLVDTYSTRYKGYRGRGGIGRWSGLQTAAMPDDLRNRFSRLNQRLAGKVTIPMTPEEVTQLNALYDDLRTKTLGLVDMPQITVGPASGQRVAVADDAIEVGGTAIAAVIYYVLLTILITIALVTLYAIVQLLESVLDRYEYRATPEEDEPSTDTDTKPQQPVKPETEGQPEQQPNQQPGPEPDIIVDPIPPLPDEDRRKLPSMDFYHGTNMETAYSFVAGLPVLAIGKGEFGTGFYTFIQEPPAIIAAQDYSRNRGDTTWGVVDFNVPGGVLFDYQLADLLEQLLTGQETILFFPDNTTRVTVHYAEENGGISREMSWKEFVDENARMGKQAHWPYNLIIGPLKGKISGFKSVNQYVFNNDGVIMLNDPRVRRTVTAEGTL